MMQEDGRHGSAIAAARDVNGDGYSDLAIAAPLQDLAASNDGALFLVRQALDRGSLGAALAVGKEALRSGPLSPPLALAVARLVGNRP